MLLGKLPRHLAHREQGDFAPGAFYYVSAKGRGSGKKFFVICQMSEKMVPDVLY